MKNQTRCKTSLKIDFSKSNDEGYFQPIILAISDSGDTLKEILPGSFIQIIIENMKY
ncbi:MAG: hypothetical protein IPH57_12905 [Saprospiraceae bacterium]|nr:hypothetical protein [Saprospiraceae bacterium]